MGFPEQLVPGEMKNQRLQPFMPPAGKGVNPDPPKGAQRQFSEHKVKDTQSGLKGPLFQEGEPKCAEDQKDLGTPEYLNFFKSYVK